MQDTESIAGAGGLGAADDTPRCAGHCVTSTSQKKSVRLREDQLSPGTAELVGKVKGEAPLARLCDPPRPQGASPGEARPQGARRSVWRARLARQGSEV